MLNHTKSYRTPLVINVLDLLVSTTGLALESAQIERKQLFADGKPLHDIQKEIADLTVIQAHALSLLNTIK